MSDGNRTIDFIPLMAPGVKIFNGFLYDPCVQEESVRCTSRLSPLGLNYNVEYVDDSGLVSKPFSALVSPGTYQAEEKIQKYRELKEPINLSAFVFRNYSFPNVRLDAIDIIRLEYRLINDRVYLISDDGPIIITSSSLDEILTDIDTVYDTNIGSPIDDTDKRNYIVEKLTKRYFGVSSLSGYKGATDWEIALFHLFVAIKSSGMDSALFSEADKIIMLQEELRLTKEYNIQLENRVEFVSRRNDNLASENIALRYHMTNIINESYMSKSRTWVWFKSLYFYRWLSNYIKVIGNDNRIQTNPCDKWK